MSENINENVQKDIVCGVAFSLQFDVSTNITDTAQLLFLFGWFFEDFSTKEKLLNMISLKENTRCIYIFTEFKAYNSKIKLPL